MPYVQRNGSGIICGIYTAAQPGLAEEWVEDGSPELSAQPKEGRISKLQATYEIERDKLNRAWLSAIIADGAQETARKAILSTQMTTLSTKLNADILAIITEA